MMKKMFLLAAAIVALPSFAEDHRTFAKLTPQAQETLRVEMLDNLLALNEILSLMAENKVKEAGEVAETRLGKTAMGKNARLPFDSRPGPQMPSEMHDIGRNGHDAASEFARAAASGDRDQALGKLPALLGICIACHATYRTR
jgi:cytochrome c556